MKLSIKMPRMERNAAREGKPSGQAFASRYRGLILSILVFLALVFAILAFNYFGSRWANSHTEEVVAIADVQSRVDSIARGLQDLKLSALENPNTPYIRGIRSRMGEDIASLDRAFADFRQKYPGTSGDDTGAAISRSLEPLTREWSYMKEAASRYLTVAKEDDDEAVLNALDAAVYQTQASSTPMHGALREIGESVRQSGERIVQQIQWVQVAGVSVGLAYLVIFILYFVRRLVRLDHEAQEARRETMEIMETVAEGLFLVDKNLTIGREYSRELENILGTTNISGKRLDELLDAIVLTSDMNTVKEFVAQLFNPRVKAKLINDLNPLDRIKVASRDDEGRGSVNYLSFGFSRVYQEKDIERVLVSVRDITRQVSLEERLERERQQNDEQIELLTSILRVDENMLNSFIRQAFSSTDTINRILQRSGRNSADMKVKANEILREVHGLKGEASALELPGFIALCNEFELKLKELLAKDRLVGDDFLRPAVLLENLIAMTERIDGLAKRIGGLGDSAEGEGATLAQKRSAGSNYDAYLARFAQ